MIDVNQILAARPVPAEYGAPMGRREYVTDPDATVVLQKVQFEDGDYDAGGAYWGAGYGPGRTLYCALDESDTVMVFIRAQNWQEARLILLRTHPGISVRESYFAPADAQWWSNGSGFIELQIGLQDAHGGAHQGQCDSDVDALSKEPYIARQLEELSPDNVKACISEMFADATEEELADHAQNLERLLWLACCDLVEQCVTDNEGD